MNASFMGYPFKTMFRGAVAHVMALTFLIGGLFFGITGFLNLLTVGTYIYTFLMVVLLFTSSDGLEPHVPPKVSMAVYGGIFLIMGWYGFFGLCISWLVCGLILGHLTDEWLRKQAVMKEKNVKKGPQLVSMSTVIGAEAPGGSTAKSLEP